MSDFDNETFYEDIFQLLPGHNFVFDLQKNILDLHKYYDLHSISPLESEPEDYEEALTKFNKI